MLAKMWKKVLLAVCIIACIYNVMSKIVNRTSLEDNLKSVKDGNTVFDFFEKEEKNSTNSFNVIENSKNEENKDMQETSSNADDNSEENKDFQYTEYIILN